MSGSFVMSSDNYCAECECIHHKYDENKLALCVIACPKLKYRKIFVGDINLMELLNRANVLESQMESFETLVAELTNELTKLRNELERNNKEMRKMLEDRRPVLLSAPNDLATGDTDLKTELGATGGAAGGRNLTYE